MLIEKSPETLNNFLNKIKILFLEDDTKNMFFVFSHHKCIKKKKQTNKRIRKPSNNSVLFLVHV